MPNILIISPTSHQSYELITSKFVGRYDSTNPRILDTFDIANEKFKENADLFPNKFSNLQGRIMKIALFNYMPYAVWEEVVSITMLIHN